MPNDHNAICLWRIQQPHCANSSITDSVWNVSWNTEAMRDVTPVPTMRQKPVVVYIEYITCSVGCSQCTACVSLHAGHC